MSTGYEVTGRTKQKERTRNALLAAARELLVEGGSPTVEQAADRAQISRTTAYRYFANRRALLVALYPEINTTSLLDDDAPADPAQRLEYVIQRLTQQVVDHEHELRAQLRLSLDPSTVDPEQLPFRKGRAIGWIEDALVPLKEQMTAREIHRLALAIRATTGIEALVWLTDIAGLTSAAAAELMRSSAQALLRDVLHERPVAQAAPRPTRSTK
jgi:AcrR family transcriptional regulator